MEITTTFDEDLKRVLVYAKPYAINNYGIYNIALEVVLKNAFNDLRNLPKLGYPKKDGDIFLPVPLKKYVEKYIDKYFKGFNNRPSVKVGNASKTFSDPAIELAFATRVKNIPSEDLTKIISGHSLLMSIENFIGELLEEYLAERLLKSGWFCCWGSSIDAVDFCTAKGDLLQVKNSDNTENSSSSRVRNGTVIKKWSRRKSTKHNTFYWDELQELTGVKNVSEIDFRKFIVSTISKNPASIDVYNEKQYSK